MKSKVLPIEMPWSCTYLVPASEFAVMQSYENSRNRILNRFMQTRMFEDIVSGESYDVGFSMITEPFTESPHFYTSVIPSKFQYIIGDLVDFIMTCIDNDTYVYIHRYIDEFYLSDSRYYNSFKMMHMFIFYGYDADRRVLYTIGYNKKAIFSKLEITFDEFEKSIDYTEDKDGKYIALIKHNNDSDEKLNLYDVRFWLDQYLNSKNSYATMRGVNNEQAMSEKLIYGIKTYDYLTMYLYYIISGRISLDNIDTRPFRQLYEHKLIMMERLTALAENKLIDSTFKEQYEPVVQNAMILHNSQIKFNLTENVNIISGMFERVKKLAETENDILTKLYGEM